MKDKWTVTCQACSSENRAGTLYCKSCGEKLAHTAIEKHIRKDKKKHKVSSKSKKKSRSFLTGFNLVFFILVAAVVLALLKPDVEEVQPVPKAAKLLSQKLAEMQFAFKKGWTYTVEISDVELASTTDSLFGEALRSVSYLDGKISGGGFQMYPLEDELLAILTFNVMNKPVYLVLTGIPTITDGMFALTIKQIRFGKLPIPGIVGNKVLEHLSKKQEYADLVRTPQYIKDIKVENSKLLIATYVFEGQKATPTAAPKPLEVKSQESAAPIADKVVEESLGDTKATGADHLLGQANIYYKEGEYELALLYYRRIVEQYPGDPRIPKIMAWINEIATAVQEESTGKNITDSSRKSGDWL